MVVLCLCLFSVDLYQGDSDDEFLLSNDNKLESSQIRNKDEKISADRKQPPHVSNINKIRDLISNVNLKKDLNNTAAAAVSNTSNSTSYFKTRKQSKSEEINSHNLIDIGLVSDFDAINKSITNNFYIIFFFERYERRICLYISIFISIIIIIII